VICAVKDKNISKKEIVHTQHSATFNEYVIYYPANLSAFGILSKMASGIAHFRACYALYKKINLQQNFNLVHVLIPLKSGILALYLKWFAQKKYVISEQSGWFMPEIDAYSSYSFFKKNWFRLIYGNAQSVHTVSNSLGKALRNLGLVHARTTRIPNVVNTAIFTPLEHNNSNTKFVHISLLTHQKNPDGMLRALAMVNAVTTNWELEVMGPINVQLQNLAQSLGINNNIKWLGEVSYAEVAQRLQRSDAQLFFTRFETFGCVIAESLCCGVPVITTQIPVVQELIQDKVNGLLAEPENDADFAKKILYFIHNKQQFNKAQISSAALNQFSYKQVSGMFNTFYEQALAKK
jgi:glycosyltransferase involved in cell wall biosynthesis